MKTILVTGGYGFIGSCFILQEIAAGNRIINLDKITYAADLDNLDEIEDSDNYDFVKGDICDPRAISKIFKKEKIDWVVNFAAESHVDNSIEKPADFIQTNILGVYNLLQNSLEYWKVLDENAKRGFRFLQISTDEVFGSLGPTGKFSEETRYDPSSPYSSSKAGGDHLVKAWNRTFGLPVILTNCSNNFGPRQHKEKLIPKIISNAIQEKQIPIYGDGKNVRDWIYVGDHTAGIKLALEKGDIGESYCFGGNCEKNNNEIVNTVCEKLDKIYPRRNGRSYKELITYVVDRLGHDKRYAIDDSKALKELGYKQSKGFEDRIIETINYYIKKK
jgi:dTDP-glucose 4,6-dehydratase